MNLFGKLVDLAHRRVFLFQFLPKLRRIIVGRADMAFQFSDIDNALADILDFAHLLYLADEPASQALGWVTSRPSR